MSSIYADYKRLFQNTPKPFAFVNMDFLNENIQQLMQRAGNKSIRIASKSIRCVHLLKYILDSSPQFTGIMSYSAEETVFLSQHGFDNILLAYPIWQQTSIDALLIEIKAGKSITLMVDCIEHVDRLQNLAMAQNITIPICIDIDMSTDFPGLHFGVCRSSIHEKFGFEALVAHANHQSNINLNGIMGYEAQIAGVCDNITKQSFKNTLIRLLKHHSIKKLTARRQQLVSSLKKTIQFVNAGGTGSLESSANDSSVTEVTIGSGFYSPALFDHYSLFKHQPAAAYAVEITRIPKPSIYTCLGGGYIASGATGKDKQPQPYLPEGCQFINLEGAGEVQTPIQYSGSEILELGDPIFMRHAKAGELCERFTTLYLIADGKIINEVPTYRGEGMCFI